MPNGRKGTSEQKKKQGAANNIGYIVLALKKARFQPIIYITTPATPLHGSAPGGLLFSGADK